MCLLIYHKTVQVFANSKYSKAPESLLYSVEEVQ